MAWLHNAAGTIHLKCDLLEYHRMMLEADQHVGEELLFVPGKDSEMGHFEWRAKADDSAYR